ncbi:MAG: hypothetical protein ACXWZI_04485 [Mycobacterium sp.]
MAQTDKTDRPPDDDNRQPPLDCLEEADASITSYQDDVLAQIRQRFKLADS